MSEPGLAERLVRAGSARRRAMVRRQAPDLALALRLKDLYVDAASRSARTAASVAACLGEVAAARNVPLVQGVAAWVDGLASLQLRGDPPAALERLGRAEALLSASGRPDLAAATQVGAVYALALLGRYDEASSTGMRATAVLMKHGDRLAAGRIQQNLGNIAFRRDRYEDAEHAYRLALRSFRAAGDRRQLAQVLNGIGLALQWQQRLEEAQRAFGEAAEHGEAAGATMTVAEVELNLGSLALLRGEPGRALRHLERARALFEDLGIPHETASAELEIAAAYLELRLLPEATSLFERIEPVLKATGMRAELAYSYEQHGHAVAALGRVAVAEAYFGKAQRLYALEGNLAGGARASLGRAALALKEGDLRRAASLARRAKGAFGTRGAPRHELEADILLAELARLRGRRVHAGRLLRECLGRARALSLPLAEFRCLTSLGLLAVDGHDPSSARASFIDAIEVIERLREPLPADRLRTAYGADKVQPYLEMVALALDAPNPDAAGAFSFAERARARALADGMEDTGSRLSGRGRSALHRRRDQVRKSLNLAYARLEQDRLSGGDLDGETSSVAEEAIYRLERELSEVLLQISVRVEPGGQRGRPAIARARGTGLDSGTVVVEFVEVRGEVHALVLVDGRVEAQTGLAKMTEVTELVDAFRFQAETPRGGEIIGAHGDRLVSRVRRHLGVLYDLLLRPVERWIDRDRLVVVPTGPLHYVPFGALWDGSGYLVERFEVIHAPSVAILEQTLARSRTPIQRPLLVAVPTPRAPLVTDEVAAIASHFPESSSLLAGAATREAVDREIAKADALHFACHGAFRPDNPSFSAIQLEDGWLTANDAADLRLRCQLVTLSACETGVSEVASGEELLGLVRGFLLAGTPSLVVSLWAVDDASAVTLMDRFYAELREGNPPGAALRRAQLDALRRSPHPYYWAPFVLIGRW